MKRELTKIQCVERSITTEFSHKILTPFCEAIERYELIQNGDKIAVCVSGGKDSNLLAKLMQWYKKNKGGIELEFITIDPGYSEENLSVLKENCELLGIETNIYSANILAAADATKKSPCGVCARMRRGWLYSRAKALGCNKIALGHHFDDVIETTLMGMLYGAQIQGMLPRLKSRNFKGIELIRPMYMIEEKHIRSWVEKNELNFITCGCKYASGESASKRAEIKELISEIENKNPMVKKNIFNSIHTADVDTMVNYKINGTKHSFLERFDFVENDD